MHLSRPKGKTTPLIKFIPNSFTVLPTYHYYWVFSLAIGKYIQINLVTSLKIDKFAAENYNYK